MPTLKAARVALLESRRSRELSDLVRRLGGVPYVAPAVREVPRLDQVPPLIDALVAGGYSMVVFLTGAGVMALLNEAERLGRLDATLTALRASTIACRGPKPSAVLKRYDVPVLIRALEPYTSAELLDAIGGGEPGGKGGAPVQYGGPNHPLPEAPRARGARLTAWGAVGWGRPEGV